MKSVFSYAAALVLMTASCLPVSAQQTERDYEPAPYTFVGVQGGVQNTLNKNYNNWKTFTSSAALSVGHFFNPKVGVRLNANGIWNKGCAQTYAGETGYYKFNYLTTSADALVNLCTTFGKKDYYPVNLYLIGGLGWFHAWNNDEAYEMATTAPIFDFHHADVDKRDAFNARIGLQLAFNLCKHVAFNLEGTYNMHAGDEATFARDNHQLVLLAGLNFKFGYKKVKKEVEPEPVVVPEEVWETRIDTTWYDDVTYRDVVKDGNIDKRIFFAVTASDVESTDAQIAAVAEFLKGVQDGEVTITAYADKGTGNAKNNMKFSQQRAEKTKKALVQKGVDPKMIKKVEWKGDTVQPYPNDNDKNRVCIITGHGIYKQQEKVVTKKFKTSERRVRVK